MTELKYGDHFQCHELLLADIVNAELTEEQEHKFIALMENGSTDQYTFATDEEIKCLGIKAGSNDLVERIWSVTKGVF